MLGCVVEWGPSLQPLPNPPRAHPPCTLGHDNAESSPAGSQSAAPTRGSLPAEAMGWLGHSPCPTAILEPPKPVMSIPGHWAAGSLPGPQHFSLGKV